MAVVVGGILNECCPWMVHNELSACPAVCPPTLVRESVSRDGGRQALQWQKERSVLR